MYVYEITRPMAKIVFFPLILASYADSVDQWERAIQLFPSSTCYCGNQHMQVDEQRLCTGCAWRASEQDI